MSRRSLKMIKITGRSRARSRFSLEIFCYSASSSREQPNSRQQSFACLPSESTVEFGIHGNIPIFISQCTYRPPITDLVFALHNLVLSRGHVGGKSKEEVLRHSLLNG